ncbi:MAG: gliding motility-associated C-terminal domain-containing protein, partial [Lentimicrobiaceae bacterium]|nr:gliding motility-associated C-terminal domain-containing protein [Lentimicrobiaceae bacterium]
DTIGSIWFVLDNQGGTAELYWTHPSNPPLASQANEFVIYRQRNGVWGIYATTDTLFYIDTIHVCGETLGYEIRLYDNSGCESVSIIKTDLFTDFITPSIPQLDSVSINHTTGNTELGWNRGTDSDVFGYIIYIFNDGKWEVVDTVMGAETTFFIDTLNDANDSIQRYRIASIDTCRNASPMGAVHNTMKSEASVVNECNRAINLSWNAYLGMPDSLTCYRIWVSVNGGAFVLLDSVPDNQFTYTHNGVVKGKYVYFVQAFNSKNGYSGTSAKTEITFDYEPPTGDVLLRYVSVVNNQDIEVAVFAADTLDYRTLFLFKSDNNKITFSQIDTKSRINNEENYFFTDNNVDVQQHTYFYIIAAADKCHTIFAYSDTANNVVLQPKDVSGDQTAINWEPYYGFPYRLDSYDMFRRTQTESTLQFIGTVPPTQLDFTETVWNLASGGGKFYYQVAANEDNTNIYGFQDKSYSNIVEITKEAITYIPNTFCPSSSIDANRVFKPVNSYVDAEEYVFSIYDRWGSLIFTTNDIREGWDGSTNGRPAAAGVYAYRLTYRLDKKNFFEKQGHVTLIR